MSKPAGKLAFAYQSIARLEAQVAELRSLLADKVTDETKLQLFQTNYGGRIQVEGGAAGIMANAFAQQLIDSEAVNYIEATFTSGAYPEIGELVVTIKRGDGLTPHQLRQKAEAERDQLLHRMNDARLNGLRQFRHNDSEGFVFGYDQAVIDEAITGHG